ncbi:protein of unknown function DUF3386 [Thermosynechococcus sp. NK55a]|jgi:hypothetical protein|uniref:DUF3386 domain-containing protein n=1 Tax=unclassified Thermosynechococcus TaxID=2622553 RepID=UPI0003D8B5CD|nr:MULTISPECIES: DUF3386 domain-containing protein [unclassified Thermosynechococcus]AHB89469.1 protein of unknown function DUF3386 [Thermosynechococcus sp. NK55a]RMH67754.1 MAG: DUF3386 domain-containing protein [Cyanobacteria bacterium J003]HIK22435.1 DUF3386 domain-containing protein [Thermosynechococcus sp. M3746_W2019_013]
MPATQALDAQALFRAAYENRYTWDENFPGFTAKVTLIEGDRTYQGQVKVSRDYSVEVSGIEDEHIRESLYNQLRDVIVHRKRNSFEAAHGKNTFQIGQTDASGAVEILVSGDAMGSNYKVRDNQIVYVSRVMGRVAFAITHQEALDTGSGYISTNYVAVFRNPQTNEVVRQMAFEDTYVPVGNYYLMSRQVVHTHENGQTSTVEIRFDDLQLLDN